MTKPVRSADDELGRRLLVEGVVPLDRKVVPHENDGGMMIYEHRDVGRGGPPRHVHDDQDEWLYVVRGDRFEVEIGDERFSLGEGDSILAPRRVPHGWLHACDEPGTLLFVAQPAGSMFDFFEAIDRRADIPADELAEIYRRHGMKLTGPPMQESAEAARR